MKDGMKVLSLEAEQIRRLNIARIQIDPNAKDPIFVVGNNDEGKSTTLDCFIWGLAGGRLPDDMIRKGAESGEIRITLGDQEPELIVRKVFKKGQNPRLVVKTADGMSGNQGTLTSIVGALGMDPAALANMDGLEQAEVVRKALGIDFADIDAKAAVAYQKRADLNRAIRDKEGTLTSFHVEQSVPDKEVDVEDLLNAQEDAQATNRDNENKRGNLPRIKERLVGVERDIEETLSGVADIDARIQTLNSQKDAMRISLDDLRKMKAEGRERLAETEAAVAALVDVDLEPIREQIRNVNTTNEKVRARAASDALAKSIADMKAKAEFLTDDLRAFDEVKRTRIAEANLPAGLEGIGFDSEKGLTFEGFPLADLGTGKRLRVATQIALSMNPRLKVLLIKAGNDLDAGNLKIIADTAAEAGAQVWIERIVAPKSGIIVEVSDGVASFGDVKSEGADVKSEGGDPGDDEIGRARAEVAAKKAAKKAAAKPQADDPAALIRAQAAKEGRLL